MMKCLYCDSDLIIINTFNCEDIYDETGYETHWCCENEVCNAYIIGRLGFNYEVHGE